MTDWVMASWWLRLVAGEKDRSRIHLFDAGRWPGYKVSICGRSIPWHARPGAACMSYYDAGMEEHQPPIPVERICMKCLQIAEKK